MAKFVEALESPMQRSGEFWQNASNILESCKVPKIITSADGESEFIATPTSVPMDERSLFYAQECSEEEKGIYSQHYAIAARTDNGKFNRDAPLFLIVNGNYANPILKFEPKVDTITILDSVFNEVEDGQKYVPTILAAIKKRTDNDNDRVERNEREDKARVRKWIKGGVAGIVVIGALGAGAGIFFKHNLDEESARNQERTAFDSKNISINTQNVDAGDLAYVPSEQLFFGDQLPEPAKDDSYQHPRKLIMDSSCKSITHVNPKTQSVRAVTDASNERLFLAVNSAGDTQVCFFGSPPRDSEVKPQIAVQVVERNKG